MGLDELSCEHPVGRARSSAGKDLKDAMAALDPPQLPASQLENRAEFSARDGPYTAISNYRSVPDRGLS